MFIKVISCSQPTWWYKDHVGKEFEVYKEDLKCPDGACYIIKDINSNGDMGNIPVLDCEELSEITEENKFINPEVVTINSRVEGTEQENLISLEAIAEIYEQLLSIQQKLNTQQTTNGTV